MRCAVQSDSDPYTEDKIAIADGIDHLDLPFEIRKRLVTLYSCLVNLQIYETMIGRRASLMAFVSCAALVWPVFFAATASMHSIVRFVLCVVAMLVANSWFDRLFRRMNADAFTRVGQRASQLYAGMPEAFHEDLVILHQRDEEVVRQCGDSLQRIARIPAVHVETRQVGA